MRVNKITLAGLVLCGSVLMTACGGGSDSEAPVASNNVAANIDPTTGASVVGSVLSQDFAFPAGVADLGTTVPTSLTLTGSGTAPTFAIKAGGEAATGEMSYGSCIFTVTNSTFPVGHRLALGQTLTVTPCALNLQTANQPADSRARPLNVTFVLGRNTSDPVVVTASINPNGTIAVNGTPIGQTVVVVATGASN